MACQTEHFAAQEELENSVDRRIICILEMAIGRFWGTLIVKCSVGLKRGGRLRKPNLQQLRLSFGVDRMHVSSCLPVKFK